MSKTTTQLEQKVQSRVVGDRIEVTALYYENGTEVHGVRRAYPKDTSPEEILDDVDKAGNLFLSERAIAEKNKAEDERNAVAQSTVDALNSKK